MSNMRPVENSLDEVQAAIRSLDLDPIKIKLMDREGERWTREYADEVEVWYRRFLFLNAKYRNQPIVVTKPIDTFWHYHILDTMKYAADCQAVFGFFLHHFPYFGMRGDDDARNLELAFGNTLEIAELEFGENMLGLVSQQETAEDHLADHETPFVASKCSDCAGVVSYDGSDDGEWLFSQERPVF